VSLQSEKASARVPIEGLDRFALVGLSLMAAQAFFYNAIFFTYALVLTDFYGIQPAWHCDAEQTWGGSGSRGTAA
jgi:hypothetical protein